MLDYTGIFVIILFNMCVVLRFLRQTQHVLS